MQIRHAACWLVVGLWCATGGGAAQAADRADRVELVPPQAGTTLRPAGAVRLSLLPEGDEYAMPVPNGERWEAEPAGAAAEKWRLSPEIPRWALLGGVLVLPLDRTLEDPVGIDGDGHLDDATELVSRLGQPRVLLPAMAGLWLAGDSYDKKTAELGLKALANAGLLTQGLKWASGRQRPDAPEDAGRFEGPGQLGTSSSFPSGHASAAFSVATVLAERYPRAKWWAYGLACAVGFTRMRKSAHFPSDVLVGAGVGIYSAQYALDHPSRVLCFEF